jgi:Endoribonuclease L-PSP
MTWDMEDARMTRDATPSIVSINPPELGTPPGYSQIVDVSAGRIIFIAGQTALDSDGNVVGKNDFAAQAAQVFRNLSIALIAKVSRRHTASRNAASLIFREHRREVDRSQRRFHASSRRTPGRRPGIEPTPRRVRTCSTSASHARGGRRRRGCRASRTTLSRSGPDRARLNPSS